MPLIFTEQDLRLQACVRASFDPDGRMNPRKLLPDGVRCTEEAPPHGLDGAAAKTRPSEETWS